MNTLPCVEIETGAGPRWAVVWLHGLGADGHDFEPIVGELPLGRLPPLRFVFPHAPLRAVTINGGMRMRAWYDVLDIDFRSRRQDAQGLRASAAQVEALIVREQARGIGAERLILAGFSQGGAVALQAGLRHPRRLAGLIALSTYLPLAGTLAAERSAANAGLPILMAHGRHDPVIPCELGEASARSLSTLGYPLEWRSYDMDHAVCREEIDDIGAWLVARTVAGGT